MELLKIHIQYKQRNKKELLRTCQSIVDQALQERGCLLSQLEVESEQGKSIFIVQQWQSWTQLNVFFNTEQFSALLGAMKLFGRCYTIQINNILLGDAVIPLETLPENLKGSMGEAWRQKQKNQKILDGKSKK